MIGMIKKDMLMVKNNAKSMLVTIMLYVFYTLMFDMDMSFLLPFMALMISISTFQYDDYNGWHAFVSTLPFGRVNVVKSKYVTTLVLIIITTIIGILFHFLISNQVIIGEYFSELAGEIVAMIFMMSVLFPILFKYGAEKGRLAMMVIGISIVGIVLLVTKFIQIDIPISFIKFFNSYYAVIFIVISIIMITLSYYISKKIYLNREF